VGLKMFLGVTLGIGHLAEPCADVDTVAKMGKMLARNGIVSCGLIDELREANSGGEYYDGDDVSHQRHKSTTKDTK
jgi:hypothetical protein